ncbi:DUF3857 domain-containing protein [Proteiniphilum acetatigenes]|uniref:DUF3857 domain-containing protein n=1 Tax=Proteiniphilum acetatigenes TaxID=294710 RepID=UPI0003A0210C|nr:DUF3857 domain-containing protein [Proteiniphilum acetatigenes]SFK88081.1 protein of unknown function [Porphyromonadaceae bacterium KH3CP3RA]
MMKKNAILSLFFFLSIMGFAQEEKYSLDFGRVTQYEMVMKEYENDPDADAVILYNQGEYFYSGNYEQGGFLLRMKKQIKIKILKQSGVQYANFEIPIFNGNSGWESIESVEGTTYNIDQGFTQTKLETRNIFEEKVDDDVRVKKIALSDVRPGSVIELSYTIVSPYFFNMRRWYFQQKIPVIFSHLKYKAIPYYEYAYILKGTDKLDIFTATTPSNEIQFRNLRYREVIYNFGMNNLPAFKDEEFISSVDDYMININFQLSKFHHPNGGSRDIMTTWPAMCDEFLKNDYFGKYIKDVEKQAPKIMSGIELKDKSAQEKIEIITEFVKSKYRWNGFSGKFADTNLKDFLKQQSGNTGNINLLLAGLLKSEGIEAYPVILSTRGNGTISFSHPFQQFFNYVIVLTETDSRIVLLDATDPLLYYAVLPEKCMNVEGLVIKPQSEEWITIQQKTSSTLQKNLKLEINPETNTIQTEALYLSTGPDAYRLRSTYLGDPDNLIRYLKEREQITATDMKLPETTALNKPFTFFFRFESPVDNHSGKLFIHPFCSLSLNKNPFRQSSRALPVDLVYLQGEAYKSTVVIPEGYKVEYIPENESIENDLISFSYSTFITGDQIVFNTQFNLKQFIIQPEEYGELKDDFNKMIKCLSDLMILVKE